MGEFALQQEGFGQLKMRTGRGGIERQGAPGAGDAFVEVEQPIMHDRDIVEGLEVVSVGVQRLTRDAQSVVVTPEALVDRHRLRRKAMAPGAALIARSTISAAAS